MTEFTSDNPPTTQDSQPVQDLISPQGTLEKNINAPFFGEYVPVNLDDAAVKQSMLDMTVVGIMFADNASESQVLLRAGNGNVQLYRVGDSVSDGVVIKHIMPDGVIVLRNGELESLSLPKNELIFDSPAKPLIEE